MADRIQMRRDTKARWEQYNPVLLEGEVGIVTDDPNLYKVGNGTSAWNSLPYRGFNGTITSTITDDANTVPSNAAVSEVINTVSYEAIDTKRTATGSTPFVYKVVVGDKVVGTLFVSQSEKTGAVAQTMITQYALVNGAFDTTIANNDIGIYKRIYTSSWSAWDKVAGKVHNEIGNDTLYPMSQKAVTDGLYKSNELLDSVDITENMLNSITVSKIVGVLTNKGEISTAYNSFSTTDFVEVSLSGSYYFKPTASISDSFAHIAFYDADKKLMHCILGRSISVDNRKLFKVLIPFDAKYIRACGALNNVPLYIVEKPESSDKMIEDKVKNDILVGGINLFNKKKIQDNTYLSPINGSITTQNNYFVSEYIDISSYNSVSTSLKGDNDSFALYDKDKNLLFFGIIKNISGNIDTSSAHYIRVSSLSYTSSLRRIMVCGGNQPSIYVPYNLVDKNDFYDISNQQYWEQLDCPIYDQASLIETTFTDGVFGSSHNNFETSDYIPTHKDGHIHYYYALSTFSSGLSKIKFYDKDKNEIGAINGAELSSIINIMLKLCYPRGCEYVRYAREKVKNKDGIYTIPYMTFEDAVKNVVNNTSQKKCILWVGTSIPEGSTYPSVSCSNNGYDCINNAYGQSRLCFTSSPTSVSIGSGRELTATVQELKSLYQSHIDSEITQQEFNQWLDKSYERSIIPFIKGESLVITDGTTNAPNGIINPNKIKVSAIVIDYGYNDYNSVNSLMENVDTINWDSNDRGNFVGAFNYLIKKIQEQNPILKIVVGGYFNYTFESSGKPLGKNLCELQTLLAKKYNFELMDAWNYTQISWVKYIPGTSSYMDNFNDKYGTSYTVPSYGKDSEGNIRSHFIYCPDGIHPHSDLTGNCNRRLNAVYTKLLRSVV